MQKKDFLIIAGGLVALAIVILIVVFSFEKSPEKLGVVTDRTEYKIGETLKIKIENDLKKNICFSSCYPYYWEKKNTAGWEDYRYVDCPNSDLATYCVKPEEIKAFELTIPSVEPGIHRLAISACLECRFQESFQEEQRFYSNDFVVK